MRRCSKNIIICNLKFSSLEAAPLSQPQPQISKNNKMTAQQKKCLLGTIKYQGLLINVSKPKEKFQIYSKKLFKKKKKSPT